jgi:hypothetical protein
MLSLGEYPAGSEEARTQVFQDKAYALRVARGQAIETG